MDRKEIILTKESSESDLKQYFEAVLHLSESEEEFPVNIDEVWPLVYGNRSNAISALRRTFMENVDFKAVQLSESQSLMQNNERDWGGQNKINYYLTTSCLEYFIARKVRPVFEVYRTVFHKVARQPQAAFEVPKTFSEALLLAAKQQEKIEQQQLLIETKTAENEEQKAIIKEKDATIDLQSGELKKSAPKVSYYDTTLQSKDTLTISEIGNPLGLGGKELNRRLVDTGIIYKRDPKSKLYLLKKPYSEWNLAQVRTRTYTRSDGSIGAKHLLVYNERGRRFITALHQCDYNVSAAIKLIQGK